MNRFSGRFICLVDCNSFFCSCERLFRPDLLQRAVGVLSNNDGCFVSRTKELKKLGVSMGAPYFKVKDLCRKHNVAVFSSNFSLYTNLSLRVMEVLSRFASRLEIYSVDEAFLDLSGMAHFNLNAFASHLKQVVWQEVGIPVSIGIGRTKGLAKIANILAKKSLKADGIVVLDREELESLALERVPVEDIWGVGRKNAPKLRSLGIKDARAFRDFKNEKLIQKIFTKTGKSIQDEFRGVICFEIAQDAPKKKEIMCSRTFGTSVFDLKGLQESIAHYATNAAEKMRQQGSLCRRVEIFLRTNPFKDTPQYMAFDFYEFDCAVSDTREIIFRSWEVLDRIYRSGFEYKKAGVRLIGLEDSCQYQLGLFSQGDCEKSDKLMKTIDKINFKEGEGTVRSLACGVDNRAWKMRQELRSPRYLSGWSELPIAKCC